MLNLLRAFYVAAITRPFSCRHLKLLCSPQSSLKVRIVDIGNQRSYVSDRVRDALSLVPEKQQRVLIPTFGSAEGTSPKVEVYEHL